MILMDKLIKALENGEFVIGVYLDFSKAFDTVNHKIMLQKLNHYGIRGNALDWFESYLSDRSQFVTYNGTKSSKKSIKCGVPQGSILGPLLFLVYINDLSNVCKHTMAILFADDTNLFKKGKNIEIMQREVHEELQNIAVWLQVNKLSLHIKKTHFMLFCNKNVSRPDIELCISGQAISETRKTKFLGVIIDNKLNWKDHIMYISGKIARGIGILTKARKLLNRETLVSIYYSFIYPHMTYCNRVWASTYETNLHKLIILQKRAVRMICGVSPRTSTATLFDQLKMMNFLKLNKYLMGRFMYRVYNSDVPNLFEELFVSNTSIYSYETRQSMKLHLPYCSTNLGKFGIRYRGTLIWNTIW